MSQYPQLPVESGGTTTIIQSKSSALPSGCGINFYERKTKLTN